MKTIPHLTAEVLLIECLPACNVHAAHVLTHLCIFTTL